jgi:hypothetical protein
LSGVQLAGDRPFPAADPVRALGQDQDPALDLPNALLGGVALMDKDERAALLLAAMVGKPLEPHTRALARDVVAALREAFTDGSPAPRQ